MEITTSQCARLVKLLLKLNVDLHIASPSHEAISALNYWTPFLDMPSDKLNSPGVESIFI